MPIRLDAELVRRGLARSRRHARAAVEAGRVQVDGRIAGKVTASVGESSTITVRKDEDDPDYASRGGVKLSGAMAALERLGLQVSGRRCLDAGASTGGFTDVLLRAGAASVVAVDVGHGQLVPRLQEHPRVRAFAGLSVRGLAPSYVGGPVDLLVADLSFISLATVLPDLAGLVRPTGGDLLLLVKPQFEVGRDRLGRGGVVRDPALRASAVARVASAAERAGLHAVAGVPSRLTGPAGNVELFWWARTGLSPATRWTAADSDRLAGQSPGTDAVVVPSGLVP